MTAQFTLIDRALEVLRSKHPHSRDGLHALRPDTASAVTIRSPVARLRAPVADVGGGSDADGALRVSPALSLTIAASAEAITTARVDGIWGEFSVGVAAGRPECFSSFNAALQRDDREHVSNSESLSVAACAAAPDVVELKTSRDASESPGHIPPAARGSSAIRAHLQDAPSTSHLVQSAAAALTSGGSHSCATAEAMRDSCAAPSAGAGTNEKNAALSLATEAAVAAADDDAMTSRRIVPPAPACAPAPAPSPRERPFPDRYASGLSFSNCTRPGRFPTGLPLHMARPPPPPSSVQLRRDGTASAVGAARAAGPLSLASRARAAVTRSTANVYVHASRDVAAAVQFGAPPSAAASAADIKQAV